MSVANTLEFMFDATHRCGSSAERFFRKAINASHNSKPRVINVDKNQRLRKAVDELKADETLTLTTELRPVKYLNNFVEATQPSDLYSDYN